MSWTSSRKIKGDNFPPFFPAITSSETSLFFSPTHFHVASTQKTPQFLAVNHLFSPTDVFTNWLCEAGRAPSYLLLSLPRADCTSLSFICTPVRPLSSLQLFIQIGEWVVNALLRILSTREWWSCGRLDLADWTVTCRGIFGGGFLSNWKSSFVIEGHDCAYQRLWELLTIKDPIWC